MQKQFLYLEGRKLSAVLKAITRRDAKLAGRIRKMCGMVALGLMMMLTPSTLKAQDDHSLNSNTHNPTMNSGHSDAFGKDPAGAPGAAGASGATAGKNDGEYIPSNFVDYKDALKAGKDAAAAPPKTLADIARENREKKAAAGPVVRLVVIDDGNGNLTTFKAKEKPADKPKAQK